MILVIAPLVAAAAITAGSAIVSSLFGGMMQMKQADENAAAQRAMFEKQKEAEFQKMYAAMPMQGAAQDQQGIGALVNSWGGTRR